MPHTLLIAVVAPVLLLPMAASAFEPEVIAVNPPRALALGIPFTPEPLAGSSCLVGALRAPRTAMRVHNGYNILVRGRIAVRSGTGGARVAALASRRSVVLQLAGLNGRVSVRDLWQRRVAGEFEGSSGVTRHAHGAGVYRSEPR